MSTASVLRDMKEPFVKREVIKHSEKNVRQNYKALPSGSIL